MVGFDIGGTKCAVCVGEEDENGLRILDKRMIATDTGVSPYKMIDRLCELMKEMLDTVVGAEETAGGLGTEETVGNEGTGDLGAAGRASLLDVIGISCGGPLDSKKGVIMSPPNLPGWDDVHIVEYLKKRYGVPVFLQNDANACAVAEWRYGAGRGCSNMVFLTFGTGMGAGLILNGQLYAGTNDMAGEIGHVRMAEHGPVGYGKAGSFEGFCSGSGIAQIAQTLARENLQVGNKVSFCRDMSQLGDITAQSVARAAVEGNEDALEVYRICGEMLGRGLAILIDILNPEKIVLGSVYQRSGHLLKEAMEKYIQRESLLLARSVCEIVPAGLEENIGDYAALAVAAMGK